jgi:two-component system, NarL family, invasion response regulator UvrY
MVTDRPLRILLVDDHSLLSAGMIDLLRRRWPDLDAKEARTVKEGREALSQGAWDLVLLDMQLSDGNGTELLDGNPDLPPMIVVTMFGGWALRQAAYSQGASGFVSKSCSPDELVDAVEQVLAGHLHFPGLLDGSGEALKLSAREQTVLDALLEGVGPQALANRLGVTQAAIQSYKRRLFEKLGISSQGELLRAAQELGNPTKASMPT